MVVIFFLTKLTGTGVCLSLSIDVRQKENANCILLSVVV